MNRLWSVLCCFMLQAIVGGVTVCDQGWVAHGDACYQYKPERYSFFEAKIICDTVLNSHLAVISSEEENTFLAKLINSSKVFTDTAWIALEDIEREGHFVWYPTHETPAYTSWLPFDPNDGGHSEDCVTSRTDGQWQDWNCEKRHAAICQRKNSGESIIG